MYFTFFRDRESRRWFRGIDPEWDKVEDYSASGRRKVYKRLQSSYIYPEPESVSCFVDRHDIIEANSEEEAGCLLRQKYPKDF